MGLGVCVVHIEKCNTILWICTLQTHEATVPGSSLLRSSYHVIFVELSESQASDLCMLDGHTRNVLKFLHHHTCYTWRWMPYQLGNNYIYINTGWEVYVCPWQYVFHVLTFYNILILWWNKCLMSNMLSGCHAVLCFHICYSFALHDLATSMGNMDWTAKINASATGSIPWDVITSLASAFVLLASEVSPPGLCLWQLHSLKICTIIYLSSSLPC